MIGYLEGEIKWKTGNKVIITSGGTGYLVFVSDLINLPDPGGEIELFIYTYVREDTLDLYGFNSMKERELFDILLSVSRVGPKAGISVLSTLRYEEFINAIMTEDTSVLKQVSGIGPKTAQRLILELEEKISELGQEYQSTETDTGKVPDDDLYEALNSLGYTRSEINSALHEIEFSAGSSLEEKIKKTLSYLGKESF